MYFCFCIQNSSPRGQKFVSKVPISYPEKNPNLKENDGKIFRETNLLLWKNQFPRDICRLTNFISKVVEKQKFCLTSQIFRQNELNVKVEFTEFLTFYWNHVVSTYSRKFPSSSQVISRFLSLFSRMLDEFHEFFSSSNYFQKNEISET